MKTTIKKRIEEINSGRVPEGYEKTSFGIFPCDWEKKKLQQICDIFSGGTPSTNIPKYWDGNIAWCVPTDITRNKKYIDSTEKYISQEGLENSSAKIMPVNSILMCSRATIGPRCINRVPMATNQGFKNLVCKKGYYYEFIYYYIEILLNHLLKKSNGSTFLELSKSELDKSECVIPQLKQEQSRIAEILMQWDKAIELQEKLIEAKQKLKKYYLKKMFPKKGSNIPEIRFPGFTAPWEQRKLGDLLQTLPFKQFLKEPEPDGKYEIIQQGNEPVIGLANGTPCGDYKDVVIFGDHTLSLYKPQRPFFVATDGVRIVKGQIDTNGYYLLSLLERYKPQSEGYKRYFSILADTNCITTYNASEQKQIGVFFERLDNLIALHQQKRDKLLKQRKAMQQYLLTGIVRV